MRHLHKRIALTLPILLLLCTFSVAYGQETAKQSVETNPIAIAVFLGVGVAVGAGVSAVIRAQLRKSRNE